MANGELEADEDHEPDKPLVALGRTVRNDKHCRPPCSDHGARDVALFASQQAQAEAGVRIRFVAAADRVRLVNFPAGLLDPFLLRAFPAAA